MRALFGPLCSLPMLFIGHSPHPCSLSLVMHILNLLMLFPLLVSLHNMCVITSISLVGGLISHPQSVITLIRLMREKEFLHSFILVVMSHVDEGRKMQSSFLHLFIGSQGASTLIIRGALSCSAMVRSDGTMSHAYPPDDRP